MDFEKLKEDLRQRFPNIEVVFEPYQEGESKLLKTTFSSLNSAAKEQTYTMLLAYKNNPERDDIEKQVHSWAWDYFTRT